MVLARLFDGRTSGFYVDVGAHHPMRFSNTYYFYQRGWRGINIDPRVEFPADFAARPRDLNLNLAVAKTAATLTYHEFDEPALNGFDAALAGKYAKLGTYKLLGTRPITAQPLREILEIHLPANQPIDFFSVDVEGLDLQVLESNDWKKYRPQAVVAELDDAFVAGDFSASPVVAFLNGVGYRVVSKLVKSVVLVDEPLYQRFRR